MASIRTEVVEGQVEKSSKDRLPPGWTARVSRTYPDRVYYFNCFTGDSMWECPVLIPRRKSSEHEDKASTSLKNSVSPLKYNVDKHDLNVAKSASSRKRKAGTAVDSSPQKSQRTSPTKACSAKSPVRPPSPAKCSDKGNLDERKGREPPRRDKTLNLGTKTAIVDPIVRKNSMTSTSPNESSAKASVFSRLCPRALSLNTVQLREEFAVKTKKRKKKKKKSKSERSLFSDSFPRAASKPSAKQSTGALPETSYHEQGCSKIGVLSSSASSKTLLCASPGTSKKFRIGVALEAPEDVEMLDVSQIATDLDETIEPMKLDEYFANGETLMLTHIVVDTNVFLSNLKFIDELKDTQFDGCGPPVIFIPWIVIQELDRVKQRSDGTRDYLSHKASESIRYIYSMFQSKHPRFRGQTSKMAAEQLPCYKSNCDDDKVLQCCEQLFQVLPKEKVILLTNDKNLINKAVMDNIVAYTEDTLKELISKAPDVEIPATATLIEKKLENEDEMKIFLDGTTCKVKCLLKALLEEVVISEFKKHYSELWDKIIVVKPPWSLPDLLFCIKKHWVAVFGFLFSDDMRLHCENLHQLLKKSKGLICKQHDTLKMFDSAEVICEEAMKATKPAATSALAKVRKLRLVCELQFKKYLKQKETSPSSKRNSGSAVSGGSAIGVFEHIWAVINNLTTLVIQCCDVQLAPTKPQELRNDIIAFLPRFYRCVDELLRCMQQALEDISSDDHIKKLYLCLINFVPCLKIDTAPPSTEDWTPESLMAFCRNAENRTLLENGFRQLRDFHSSLDRCIAKNGSLIVRGISV